MLPTAGQTAGLNGLKFWTLMMGSLGVTLAKKSGFFFKIFIFLKYFFTSDTGPFC